MGKYVSSKWGLNISPGFGKGSEEKGAWSHIPDYVVRLLRLERKQTNSWNPFRVRIFLFLSLILTWNWNDKYLSYTPVVPSKTTPDSRLKWAKCIPVFRPKLRKNPTQWGGTCLYSLHKAVPPGGTPINGLDGFLRVSIGIKNTGYHFALVATVFPVWSLLR